jgi:hypothetical protein
MARQTKPWHRRKRRWLAAIIVGGMALLLLLLLSQDLKPLVEWAGRRAGVAIAVDSARLGWYDFRVKNISVSQPGEREPFARINFLEISWAYLDLLHGRVETINLQGPALSLRGLEKFQSSQAKPGAHDQPKSTGGPSGIGLSIGTLIIRNGMLTLDNLGPGMPAIPIEIASVDPIVVNNLQLGAGGNDGGSQTDQTITVENLVINSPYDPLTSILKFEQISLTFNWAGIQKQHIQSLTVKNPTVYIGPDLFYFADQVQAAPKEAPQPGAPAAPVAPTANSEPAPPWTLDYFRLTGGKLVVYSFGKPGFALPMVFSAESDNMVLDNFAALPFNKLGFDIPPTDLEYKNLGLTLHELSGSLFVGLPLSDPKAQNLTPNLEIEQIDWKNIKATKVKTFVTFSRDGIITKLWAKAEQGDLYAGVHVDLNDFSWTGWGSAGGVMLGHLTQMLSPENFLMDGSATGRFIVHGKLSEVSGMGATLQLDQTGKIQIVSVDEMMKDLPGDWWKTKRDAVGVLLKAFRDYDYANGEAEFTFAPPESFLKLSLDGKQGKRSFDLHWHDRRENPGFGF